MIRMIFDRDRWIEIWVTITRNKTRSLLTCFGVFWGILMLVILLGAGAGLKNAVLGETEGVATNSVFFFSDRTSIPYKGFNKGRSWNIRNRDIEAIRRDVEGVDQVAPMIFGASGDKNVVFGVNSGTYQVKGVTPAYFQIEVQNLLYGRLLNEIDERERRKVCTIGESVNDALFHGNDPCGKYIRVNGLYYQVVGVTKSRSQAVNIGGRSDESVCIPFNTLQQSMHLGDIVYFFGVSIFPTEDIGAIITHIKQILFAQNEIAPDDPQAVAVINIAEMFQTFNLLFTGIDVLIWIVGMGTLLPARAGRKAVRHYLAGNERKPFADGHGGTLGLERGCVPLGFHQQTIACHTERRDYHQRPIGKHSDRRHCDRHPIGLRFAGRLNPGLAGDADKGD